MRVGIVVPQGWVGEYDDVSREEAWQRTVEVATAAERLGFDSIWVFDHLQPFAAGSRSLTFEAMTTLAALASHTTRVRLGQIVISAGYRNPALLAKMISTLDVVSGGRVELGIGAGWKQDEWEAYGYGYPPLRERLAVLADALEVITRLFADGRASYEGRYASIHEALNEPKGLQRPRPPIIVGGNGPEVTWRLAARYGDELNLDSLTPEEVESALPTIRQRCDEIGRDPASLRVSVHAWWEYMPRAGRRRAGVLRAYADLGVDRVMLLVPESATDPVALDELAADAVDAGLTLDQAEQ